MWMQTGKLNPLVSLGETVRKVELGLLLVACTIFESFKDTAAQMYLHRACGTALSSSESPNMVLEFAGCWS